MCGKNGAQLFGARVRGIGSREIAKSLIFMIFYFWGTSLHHQMVLGPPICFSILWAFLSHQAPMQVSPPNSHPRVRPPCPPFASARKEMDYQFARAPLDNLEWFTHKPKKNITHFHDPKPWRLFTWNLAALAFIFPHHISPNQMDSKTKYEKSPINSPRQNFRHDWSILLIVMPTTCFC